MEESVSFDEINKLINNEDKNGDENKDTNEPKIVEVEDEPETENKTENKKVVIDESQNIVTEYEKEEPPPKKTIEELMAEYLEKKEVKILIGLLTSNDKVSIGYNQSMVQLAINFTKLNIPFDILSIKDETITARGKNCIIARVLSEKSYTHLLFIDTNITFNWFDVCHLILEDREVCGGCIPKRNINYNKMVNIIVEELRKEEKDRKELSQLVLQCKSMDYHFHPVIIQEENENGEKSQKINIEGNMVEVEKMGTHFMMIKREALELMADKLGILLKFTNNYAAYQSEEIKDHFYSFFERERTSEGYLNENEVFCNRWHKCGGKIWVNISANLNANYSVDNQGCLYLSMVN